MSIAVRHCTRTIVAVSPPSASPSTPWQPSVQKCVAGEDEETYQQVCTAAGRQAAWQACGRAVAVAVWQAVKVVGWKVVRRVRRAVGIYGALWSRRASATYVNVHAIYATLRRHAINIESMSSRRCRHAGSVDNVWR